MIDAIFLNAKIFIPSKSVISHLGRKKVKIFPPEYFSDSRL